MGNRWPSINPPRGASLSIRDPGRSSGESAVVEWNVNHGARRSTPTVYTINFPSPTIKQGMRELKRESSAFIRKKLYDAAIPLHCYLATLLSFTFFFLLDLMADVVSFWRRILILQQVDSFRLLEPTCFRFFSRRSDIVSICFVDTTPSRFFQLGPDTSHRAPNKFFSISPCWSDDIFSISPISY